MPRTLITSALPYINGVKHLGNLAGSMLPADVHARFRRMQGHEVLFLCATDEHGTPAELGAEEAGQEPRAYCDAQYAIQRGIYEQFDLSFDWFGRSSSLENRALTQHFCDRLEDNGFIEERLSRQVYSVADGRFLPDRYVEGICPHCGYDGARGDQCDNCSKLLDPTELIKPRSKISGSEDLEIRETAHLYLLQSKLAEAIGGWVERAGDWPALAKSIARKWLDEGLDDRSITRDLAWGVPVTRHGKPRPGFENKVFYVWFDAPIEYIACAQEWAAATGNDWERWWRRDKGADEVNYVQFMGKDNVAFHAVNFPATLIGSGEPWKMVDQIKAFNWVTWYGGKFSTSHKRGIFMDSALDVMPADAWRWKLMASAPESSDSAFTLTEFRNGVNSDLGNVFGNFINRIVRFTEAKFDGAVPDGGAWGEAEDRLAAALDTHLAELTQHHEAMEFRKAASETRAIWGLANEYLTEAAPWTAIKTDREAAAVGGRTGLNLCVLCALVAFPFIPGSAAKVLAAFGINLPLPGGEADRRAGEGTNNSLTLPSPQGRGEYEWPAQPAKNLLTRLAMGMKLGTLPVLFPRIEDAQVADWEIKFGAPT